MTDLLVRLLDPEKVEEALEDFDDVVAEVDVRDAIRELHRRIAAVQEQRDFAQEVMAYASGKREQDWKEGVIGTAEALVGAIRYQHEIETQARLTTAKLEGAAEVLEKICMDVSCGGHAYSAKIHLEDGTYYKLGVVEASVIFAHAAAIRKGLAKEGK